MVEPQETGNGSRRQANRSLECGGGQEVSPGIEADLVSLELDQTDQAFATNCA